MIPEPNAAQVGMPHAADRRGAKYGSLLSQYGIWLDAAGVEVIGGHSDLVRRRFSVNRSAVVIARGGLIRVWQGRGHLRKSLPNPKNGHDAYPLVDLRHGDGSARYSERP